MKGLYLLFRSSKKPGFTVANVSQRGPFSQIEPKIGPKIGNFCVRFSSLGREISEAEYGHFNFPSDRIKSIRTLICNFCFDLKRDWLYYS